MKGLEGDKLHKTLAQIVANQQLRSQATSLKGNDAVKLCDLIHRVPYSRQLLCVLRFLMPFNSA